MLRPLVALTVLATALALAMRADVPAARAASASVTLSAPPPGSVTTTSTPTFAGSAGTASGDATEVEITVYDGAGTSGTVAGEYFAPVTNGTYSTTPQVGLAQGLYTAVATQQTGLTSSQTSAPISFGVDTQTPALEMNAASPQPTTSSRPTVEGYSDISRSAGPDVTVAFFAGNGTDSTPVDSVTVGYSGNGRFTAQPTAPLPDGVYTALAEQTGSDAEEYSGEVALTIKAHPPALTLTAPSAGAEVGADRLVLSGAAGNEVGDSPRISVALYRGEKVTGSPVHRVTVERTGARWQVKWPNGLRPGRYVAQATQRDDAGHVTRQTVALDVVQNLRVIGGTLSIRRGGTARIDVACLASSGSCTGDVLVLTRRAFRPQADGPKGALRVMFAYFSIPAGEGLPVSQSVPSEVLDALRRSGEQPFRVTVAEQVPGNPRPRVTAAQRSARVGG